MTTNNDRARGALLGLAVGDALGTTLEFSRPPGALSTRFPAKMTGPLTRIVGAGPFNVDEGQVTDDTQMASALARSLAFREGYNPADVAVRYKLWRSKAFDCGGQTGSSISQLANVTPGREYEAGHLRWRQSRSAAGNGSLMRTVPIGVYFADNAPERTRASILDSAMTHADPRCMLACAAYNWAVARSISSVEAPTVSMMFTAAEAGIEAGVEYIETHLPDWFTPAELQDARTALYTDLTCAMQDDPGLLATTGPKDDHEDDLDMHGSQGFVRVGFRYAFWALAHAENYSEAIIDVVNRGGDSDTNGAIVGGLLGSFFGASGIPEIWRNQVLTAMHEKPVSVWWRIFHPRFLLSVTSGGGYDPKQFVEEFQEPAERFSGYTWPSTPSATAWPDEETVDAPLAEGVEMIDDEGPLFDVVLK